MRRQDKLAKVLEGLGASVARQRRHTVYMMPNGLMFTAAKTPGDRRSEMNAISRARRIARAKRA